MKPYAKVRAGRVMLCIATAAVLITGCATAGKTPGQRLDPFEKFNRDVFGFNEKLDENVLKPVATGYSNVVPQPVRQGVDNFFANVADAWSAINNILQLKIADGLHDMIRVGTNTLFGLGGVLDVASEMGLEHHNEDLGQTLGHYGVGAGAYLVLPLLGPSTVRDAAALPFDRLATPAVLINDGGAQLSITALQIINVRANLLGASRVLDDIALDKYTFVRDAYLQRRRSLVYDGDAPPLPEDTSPLPAPGSAASAAAAEAAAAASAPAAAASAASSPARR